MVGAKVRLSLSGEKSGAVELSPRPGTGSTNYGNKGEGWPDICEGWWCTSTLGMSGDSEWLVERGVQSPSYSDRYQLIWVVDRMDEGLRLANRDWQAFTGQWRPTNRKKAD